MEGKSNSYFHQDLVTSNKMFEGCIPRMELINLGSSVKLSKNLRGDISKNCSIKPRINHLFDLYISHGGRAKMNVNIFK